MQNRGRAIFPSAKNIPLFFQKQFMSEKKRFYLYFQVNEMLITE